MEYNWRQYQFIKNQKEYITEIKNNNLNDIEKEFKKIIKKFKKCNNFDSISIKIDIKYHDNDEFMFFRGC